MLTEAEIQRYSRHVLLRELGGTGQRRLLDACVRVPRLDAAGRACALWLARAGVGALSIPEDESPAPERDPSGLLLAADAGRPLAVAVRERLRFHAPALAFRDDAEVEASGQGGPESALEAIRRVVQGSGSR